MERLERFTRTISRYMEGVGVIFFLFMLFANLIDVIGAKLFRWPLPGALEIISFSQVIAISFAIAFGLFLGTHLRIEFLAEKLPSPVKKALEIFVSASCLLFFILLFVYAFKYARSLQLAGEIGSVSKIPFYPFAYGFAMSVIPILLYYFIDLTKKVRMKI